MFEKKDVYGKCTYILPRKGEQCNKKSYLTINGKYCCTTHSKTIIKNKEKELTIKKIPKKKATTYDPEYLAKKMYTKLDQIKFGKIDMILIENQPSLVNPAMKSIACFLFAYFIQNYKDASVKFISPSNKLKIEEDKINIILKKMDKEHRVRNIMSKLLDKYLDTTQQKIKNKFVEPVLKYLMNRKETLKKLDTFPEIKNTESFTIILKKIEKDNKNYEINKLLSIEYTNILVDDKWKNKISFYKKKDDICDAFLQAYHYINK